MTLKWHRIWAITIRHLVQMPTDFNKLSSVLYWPLVDIMLMGYMGLWMSNTPEEAKNPIILLAGIVLWQVVNRACLGIALNLLEELWSRNITNLFATPLTITEWILATMIEGTIVLLGLLFFCIWVTYLIFGINILSLGWSLALITGLAFAAGTALGFLSSAFILYWGQRIQSLVWMVCWGFAVFSGAFYPIEVLPSAMQTIASALPLMHIFNTLHVLCKTGELPLTSFAYAAIITFAYLLFSIIVFMKVFSYSKHRGLARLMD